MATPAIAHFGTTIIEPPPPGGVDQQHAPIEGALKDTLEFLRLFGFQPHLQNMYPGIGRQYIWRRGTEADPDYVEKDNFTSYTAKPRPPLSGPRQGDTIFRLTHADPRRVLAAWQAKGLVSVADGSATQAFADGLEDWLLLRGPDGQEYELGPTQPTRRENHCVYIWTQPSDLADTAQAFINHFGLTEAGSARFHEIAEVSLLGRTEPGVTVGLLTPLDGSELAPRWTEDIFVEAGYSHYRLGATDQTRTVAASREAFPPGGDVAFVYFRDSYLELVQA